MPPTQMDIVIRNKVIFPEVVGLSREIWYNFTCNLQTMIPHVPALRKTSCYTRSLRFSGRGRREVGDTLE